MARDEEPRDYWSSNEDDALVPLGVNPQIPSPARMYDYYLGGKTNYAVDRDAAEMALSVVPSSRQLARANRYFLVRAVLYMADQGITQFLDLGAGIPESPNVHDLAQAIHPDSRVLYVDNDPTAMAHIEALPTVNVHAQALQADIRRPDDILNSPELADTIDTSKPVGVLFVAVLHFIENRDHPQDIVRAFTDRIVPGSYLAFSHITSDGTSPEAITAIQSAYANASAPAVFRTESEIGALFSDLELIDPGLTEVTHWSPPFSAARTAESYQVRFLAGIGRKNSTALPVRRIS